jgi:NAD(P)-dependent dehydrogenase (short-subunit alcohol dehydrogenase family)
MEIKGKVFIVTGGASGLGEGTARMLAAQGGTVVIADMQTDKGEQVAKDIGGAFVKCDVSNEADGQAVVVKAVSLGKLMGLVTGIAPAETVGKNGPRVGRFKDHHGEPDRQFQHDPSGRRGHVQE